MMFRFSKQNRLAKRVVDIYCEFHKNHTPYQALPYIVK